MTPGREEALKSRLARFANPWTIQIRDRQGRWSESGQRVAMSYFYSCGLKDWRKWAATAVVVRRGDEG